MEVTYAKIFNTSPQRAARVMDEKIAEGWEPFATTSNVERGETVAHTIWFKREKK